MNKKEPVLVELLHMYFPSRRQKLNSKCLQIPTGNYFISNTKQY